MSLYLILIQIRQDRQDSDCDSEPTFDAVLL